VKIITFNVECNSINYDFHPDLKFENVDCLVFLTQPTYRIEYLFFFFYLEGILYELILNYWWFNIDRC